MIDGTNAVKRLKPPYTIKIENVPMTADILKSLGERQLIRMRKAAMDDSAGAFAAVQLAAIVEVVLQGVSFLKTGHLDFDTGPVLAGTLGMAAATLGLQSRQRSREFDEAVVMVNDGRHDTAIFPETVDNLAARGHLKVERYSDGTFNCTVPKFL